MVGSSSAGLSSEHVLPFWIALLTSEKTNTHTHKKKTTTILPVILPALSVSARPVAAALSTARCCLPQSWDFG